MKTEEEIRQKLKEIRRHIAKNFRDGHDLGHRVYIKLEKLFMWVLED